MTIKKFLTITLVALFCVCGGKSMAYDFSFAYQGKTLYYDITSSTAVKVTFKSRGGDDFVNYINGDIVIPAKVSYMNKNYTVTAIGRSAFEDCSRLTSVKIEAPITYIGEDAFEGCSRLKSINLPNSVISIGESAFSDCIALKSITIPAVITVIREGTFSDCRSLTSIEIPATVTSIGEEAFEGCNRLKSIYSKNPNPPAIDDETFEGISRKAVVYVPTNSVSKYKQSAGWLRFANIQGKKF